MSSQDIVLLREVVRKLVPMLAGQGLRVTQQGSSAYVETDADGKPVRVNIPHIPDDASLDLILAIQGFIDHEVGHILITDFAALAEAYRGKNGSKRLGMLWNIVEDTFIERGMGKRFPGAVHNLARLHEFFIEKITKPAVAAADGEGVKELQVLLVPICRAWSGQTCFQEYLDREDIWSKPVIKAFVDRVPADTIAKIPLVKTSWEALDIARVFESVLFPKREESEEGAGKGEKEHTKDKTKAGGGKTTEAGESGHGADAKESEAGGGGEDDAEHQDDAETTTGSTLEQPDASDEEHEEDDQEDKPSESDDDDAEDVEAEESKKDEGEPEDAETPEKDDDSSHEAEDDGDDEPEDAESRFDENSWDGDEEEERKAGEEDDKSDEPASGAPSEGSSTPFSAHEIDLTESGFEEALFRKITDEASRQMRDADYRVFSRDFDVVEKYQPSSSFNQRWLSSLEEKTRHMVGKMQKDVERMMAQRSAVINVGGYRSGRLNSSGLHRIAVNDDRVFRRKQENHSTDTAVSLLVDNSGSMSGPKITLAMQAAYALSSTLERVGISYECLGFTTFSRWSPPVASRPSLPYGVIAAEEKRLGKGFSRVEPLYMPIFKDFDERLTPTTRQRYADVIGAQGFLANNVDGECVEIAGMRLAKRPQKRKVLIVLSDGFPAADGVGTELYSHLHKVIEDMQRRKIDTIGIGIMSDAVRSFYPRNLVIHDINKLPGAVMGELKTILMT